ncbi:MAG TPA: hemolysin family protein [Vicinamibacteria bacterium]
MGDDGILLELALIGVLILVNAFFAGAEIAVVSARAARLRTLADEGSRRADAVLRLKADPDRFLATVQVGVTVVSTLASAVGGVAAIERLEPWIAALPWPWLQRLAEPLAVAVVVFVIAYLSLVVGELVPKSLAVRHAEAIALRVAPVIEWTSRLAGPAVTALAASSRFLLRLLGQKGEAPLPFHSLEDLKAIAEEAGRQGVVSDGIVAGAVEFHERDVREIMTPRPRIAALRADATLEEAVRLIRETGHSRYPIYEGQLDNVVGFVYARDVYDAALAGQEAPLPSLARAALSVPAGRPATALLEQMRTQGVHVALVVDEHGSLEGLVTLEDLVEVIVGEIHDEHRLPMPLVKDLGGGQLEVDGSVPIHELETDHGLELPESSSYVTLAGLVLERLGHIPQPGQSVEVAPYRLTVLALEGRRVARIRVEPLPGAPAEPDGD